MPIRHTIQEGDSIIGLADEHGLFAQTIWDDGANAELKKKRQDMNVLMPGDVVVIPDKQPKDVTKPDKKRHKFKRKGIPAVFRIQVFDVEEPRANQDYTLDVDGTLLRGKTDGNGMLQEFVPPNARQGKLVVGPDHWELLIQFGHLDPHNETSGVQKRLNNMGYDCGEPDGELNPQTRQALSQFQARVGLKATGNPDQGTLDKLKELHDNVGKFPVPAKK